MLDAMKKNNKEAKIIDIIDSSFRCHTPSDNKEEEDDEEYYKNSRHCNLHKVDHLISPALLGKKRKSTKAKKSRQRPKYSAIQQNGYV